MPIENMRELLKTLCANVYLQGSAPAKHPDRFFTIWPTASDNHKHYDNQTFGFAWAVEINFYSTDPADVYATLDAARDTLLAAGWKVSGRGYAVASDTQTHTGRGFEAKLLEI